MKKFNLITDAWIPIAGHPSASLKEVFSSNLPALPAVGGSPRQKIALTKLLLAIAQATYTPKNRKEWAEMGSDGLARTCSDYLERWHDVFYLYGDRPFLQMPVQGAKPKPYSAFMPESAFGNNSVVTRHQVGRTLDDTAKALLLVTEMSMCMGTKRSDQKFSLAKGYEKASTAAAGPGMGVNGYLHSFLTGTSIRETVWLNLLTQDDIDQMAFFPEGLGIPPWEQMPETEICPRAEQLRASLQGRLVPMARFCLLKDDEIHVTSGILHKDRSEGVWDPSAAVKINGGAHGGKPKYDALWCDPEKSPWRSLSSLLAFLSSVSAKDGFKCMQLERCVPRLRDAKLEKFGIWSGGLKVKTSSNDQCVGSEGGYVESETQFYMADLNDPEWFPRFMTEMKWLDDCSKLLYGSVSRYFNEQMADGQGFASQATGIFWEKTGWLFQEIVNACAGKDEAEAMRKRVFRIILDSYDQICGNLTSRQMAAWAKHRPGKAHGSKGKDKSRKVCRSACPA